MGKEGRMGWIMILLQITSLPRHCLSWEQQSRSFNRAVAAIATLMRNFSSFIFPALRNPSHFVLSLNSNRNVRYLTEREGENKRARFYLGYSICCEKVPTPFLKALFSLFIIVWELWSSKCAPRTCSITITWELVGNANSQALLKAWDPVIHSNKPCWWFWYTLPLETLHYSDYWEMFAEPHTRASCPLPGLQCFIYILSSSCSLLIRPNSITWGQQQ